MSIRVPCIRDEANFCGFLPLVDYQSASGTDFHAADVCVGLFAVETRTESTARFSARGSQCLNARFVRHLGAFSAIVRREILIRGAIVSGFLLFLAVAALGYMAVS